MRANMAAAARLFSLVETTAPTTAREYRSITVWQAYVSPMSAPGRNVMSQHKTVPG